MSTRFELTESRSAGDGISVMVLVLKPGFGENYQLGCLGLMAYDVGCRFK